MRNIGAIGSLMRSSSRSLPTHHSQRNNHSKRLNRIRETQSEYSSYKNDIENETNFKLNSNIKEISLQEQFNEVLLHFNNDYNIISDHLSSTVVMVKKLIEDFSNIEHYPYLKISLHKTWLNHIKN